MQIFESKKDLVQFWFSSVEKQDEKLTEAVKNIINDVRIRKDAALFDYTERFDDVKLNSIRVDKNKIKKAQDALDFELKKILIQAAENIKNYHRHQIPKSWTETSEDGITFGQYYSSVESVGIYVPGGRAVYISTLLMNCIPAILAGVPRIAITSPPGSDGNVSPLILACASLLGIGEIYGIGGAQAVAALAYGTESVQPVVKIVGPGNKYVNEAKRQVFGKVGIDMPAGPSEIVILADETAPVNYVIWDLIAQAEHDPDAKTLLITTSDSLLKQVQNNVGRFIEKTLRKKIVSQSLYNSGALMHVASLSEGIDVINTIAPEHLEIMTKNPQNIVKKIRNAGAVFIGFYTPGAVGDYWAGPNHTLPTAGAAKFASPLNVLDFMKFKSITEYNRKAFEKSKNSIVVFARAEKLFAHAQSIEVRSE